MSTLDLLDCTQEPTDQLLSGLMQEVVGVAREKAYQSRVTLMQTIQDESRKSLARLRSQQTVNGLSSVSANSTGYVHSRG